LLRDQIRILQQQKQVSDNGEEDVEIEGGEQQINDDEYEEQQLSPSQIQQL
jgi:hypothetical protein